MLHPLHVEMFIKIMFLIKFQEYFEKNVFVFRGLDVNNIDCKHVIRAKQILGSDYGCDYSYWQL